MNAIAYYDSQSGFPARPARNAAACRECKSPLRVVVIHLGPVGHIGPPGCNGGFRACCVGCRASGTGWGNTEQDALDAWNSQQSVAVFWRPGR